MDFRRALILLVMDVLLLAELTVAIWWAHFVPQEISWRFMQVFVPSAFLTILGVKIAFRRWAPKVKTQAGAADTRPWRPVDLFGALGNSAGSMRRNG